MRKHRMLGRVALAASSWELLRAWLARELSDILGRQSALGGSRITEAALTGSAGRTLVMDKKWTIMGSRTAPLQEKQMHTSVHYNIQLTHNHRREWRFINEYVWCISKIHIPWKSISLWHAHDSLHNPCGGSNPTSLCQVTFRLLLLQLRRCSRNYGLCNHCWCWWWRCRRFTCSLASRVLIKKLQGSSGWTLWTLYHHIINHHQISLNMISIYFVACACMLP